MPIHGISDKRRLTWAGKFRLGEKVKRGGREFPRALDYFRFDPNDPADVDGFRAVYGERPKALRIFLPHEDPEVYFPQALKAYGKGRGLYCRGDGQTAHRVRTKEEMVDDQKGGKRKVLVPVMRKNGRPETDSIPCVPDLNREDCCPIWASKNCRPIGTLIFSLVDFRPFTYWAVVTTSYHGMVNINSALESIRGVMGGIAGLTLRLVVQPKQVREPASGRLQSVNVMAIETLTEDERKKVIPPERVFGLPAPPTSRPDDLYLTTGTEPQEPRTPSGKLVPVPEGDVVLQELGRRARELKLTPDEWAEMVTAAEGNLIALDAALRQRESPQKKEDR